MSHNNKSIVIIIGIAILAVFAFSKNVSGNNDLTIKPLFFDSNKQPINTQSIFSTVSFRGTATQGVAYIKLQLAISNTGGLPLSVVIGSSYPTEVDTAFSNLKTAIQLQAGESRVIESDFIPLVQWEGKGFSIVVPVKATYSLAGQQKTINTAGTLGIKVDADPIANISITLTGSTSGTIAPPSPTTPIVTTPTITVTVPNAMQNSVCTLVIIDLDTPLPVNQYPTSWGATAGFMWVNNGLPASANQGGSAYCLQAGFPTAIPDGQKTISTTRIEFYRNLVVSSNPIVGGNVIINVDVAVTGTNTVLRSTHDYTISIYP